MESQPYEPPVGHTVTLPPFLRRVCSRCGSDQQLPTADVLTALRRQGQFRREAKPETEILLAVLNAGDFSDPQLSCDECPAGKAGWDVAPEEADWDDITGGPGKRCESCGEPIEEERLEVFADATQCAACARSKKPPKQSTTTAEDYCPHCGDLLTTKIERQRVTRYVIRCKSCGWTK